MTPLLKEIGEEGVWKIVQPFIAQSPQMLVGFGDDTAAVSWPVRAVALLTSDMLVEGIHFRRDLISWRDLGHKAIAVNVSDVAAMGGHPTHALISIGLPPEFDSADLKALYQGMAAEAKRHGAVLAGGDTVRSRDVVISVALLGQAHAGAQMALRSNGRAGQTLYVTGTLGDSAAGLALLTRKKYAKFLNESWAKTLIRRHRRPTARLNIAQALVSQSRHLAMIDLSDSLEQSFRLLAEASRVTVKVDANELPLSRALLRFSEATGEDPLKYAVRGGEDYELLFATQTPIPTQSNRVNVTAIGQLIKGPPIVAGLPEISGEGFRHF